MELIDLIYGGLKISIAMLGVVLIFSYLVSKLRLNSKKTDNDNKSNLHLINTPTIIPKSDNFYYYEAFKLRDVNSTSKTNINLRYLKSSTDILKESSNNSKTRYIIINEEMRKKSNNSIISFM